MAKKFSLKKYRANKEANREAKNKATFHSLDFNRTGRIDKRDLARITSGLSRREVARILVGVGKPGSRTMDYDEFRIAMKKIKAAQNYFGLFVLPDFDEIDARLHNKS